MSNLLNAGLLLVTEYSYTLVLDTGLSTTSAFYPMKTKWVFTTNWFWSLLLILSKYFSFVSAGVEDAERFSTITVHIYFSLLHNLNHSWHSVLNCFYCTIFWNPSSCFGNAGTRVSGTIRHTILQVTWLKLAQSNMPVFENNWTSLTLSAWFTCVLFSWLTVWRSCLHKLGGEVQRREKKVNTGRE